MKNSIVGNFPPSTGAFPSPKDLRTFGYKPNYKTAPLVVGTRWLKETIRDQSKVGICTAISIVMQANRHWNMEFSPEFQYLMQKTEYDKDWEEGSSALHSLKVANNIGFLPKVEFDKWITEDYRNLGYTAYIRKLQKIPASEIDRLKTIAANYKLAGYYLVPSDWNVIKNAIAESKYGLIARFDIGTEWYKGLDGKNSWDKEKLEPLRPPTSKTYQSGHLLTKSNANGESYRLANSWGAEWCDEGTAYSLWSKYKPTELWLPVFPDTEKEADVLEERRKLEETLRGLLIQWIQKLLSLMNK